MRKLYAAIVLLLSAVAQAGATDPTTKEVTPKLHACECNSCTCGCGVDDAPCKCKDICGWFFNTNPETGEAVGVVQIMLLPNGEYFVAWMYKSELAGEQVGAKQTVAVGKRLKNVLAVSWGKEKQIYLYEITKGKLGLQISNSNELWTPITPPKLTSLQMETLLACAICFQADVPSQVDVTLNDGSRLLATLQGEHVKIKTAFGELQVPIKSIHRIEFGLHAPEGAGRKIVDALNALGASAYKDRDAAEKTLLHYGAYCYGDLQFAFEVTDNPEVKIRAQKLIQKIEAMLPKEILNRKAKDTIYTKEDGTLVGKILSDVKVSSDHVGELTLKLFSLKSVLFGSRVEVALEVDAAEHNAEKWLNTKIHLSHGYNLTVKAEGKVDLWPTTPNQYLSDPNGAQGQQGKGGTFKAGSLVGKIGEKGIPFLAGSNFQAEVGSEGELYLAIVQSSWNNASQGKYTVRIKADAK